MLSADQADRRVELMSAWENMEQQSSEPDESVTRPFFASKNYDTAKHGER
jgi:hypothetical protein